jgi:glycosyltransferase involved in cell wall biosynthesis
MRFSVITPNYNGATYLEQAINSVLAQSDDVELEYIVIDGGSSDGSLEIIGKYKENIAHCLVEPDNGPAHAINKGLQLVTGDIVSWLNADDFYYPGALARVGNGFSLFPRAAMFFGVCPIVDETNQEIRGGITRFKEFFYPLSSRFTYQCINYISQPSLFFAGHAGRRAGLLREDMKAAWDYEYILRLWRYGSARRIKGSPLAAFRWTEGSISGQNFSIQFEEEYEAAKSDAGVFSVQAGIHFLVRWAIVGIYSAMSLARKRSKQP